MEGAHDSFEQMDAEIQQVMSELEEGYAEQIEMHTDMVLSNKGNPELQQLSFEALDGIPGAWESVPTRCWRNEAGYQMIT